MLQPLLKLIGVLSVPFFILSLGVGKNDNGYIDWSNDRKLTWDDFKGKPEQGADRAALSFIQIHADFGYKNNTLSWHITCRFDKKKSWGKTKTDYILTHEQAHFDITEVHARLLNQRLSEYKFNEKTFQKDLDNIYNSTMKEENGMQEAYDKETDHSIIKEKQAEWLKKVKKLLTETAPWSDYR